jgi:CheY-like chemotaxis protein
VIDDDPVIRALVRDVLELDGYRVTTAVDGAALAHAAPGVVLLDRQMSNVDGWEFGRRYRAAAAATAGHAAPIVVMAGGADARRWCEEVGADACLPKSFRLAELQGLVAGHCGRVP